jgi:hypothetical protein
MPFIKVYILSFQIIFLVLSVALGKEAALFKVPWETLYLHLSAHTGCLRVKELLML